MGYHKIDPRLWESGSYKKLSPLQCSGQGLWLFLLSCPQRHSSGIFRLGRGAIQDTTGWERDPLDAAFAELVAEQMAQADWSANIVRLVNAAQHCSPENRNVAFHWGRHLESFPPVPVVIAHCIELQPLLKRFAIPLPERFTQRFGDSLTLSLSLSLTPPKEDTERERGASAPDSEPYQQVLDSWNATCHGAALANFGGLPVAKLLTDGRKKAIRARLKEHTLEELATVFARVASSTFLTGGCPGKDGAAPFVASFDWVMKPSNMTKIIEGNYDDRKPRRGKLPGEVAAFDREAFLKSEDGKRITREAEEEKAKDNKGRAI